MTEPNPAIDACLTPLTPLASLAPLCQAALSGGFPLLPDLVLMGLAGALLALLARRTELITWPVLLAAGAGGIAVVGTAVDAAMWADGRHPGPADLAQQWPLAAWHLAAMVLLAGGALLAAWNRRLAARRAGRHASRTSPLACAVCRDETLPQVCVVPGEGTVAACSAAFARLVGLPPEEIRSRPLGEVLSLPAGILEDAAALHFGTGGDTHPGGAAGEAPGNRRNGRALPRTVRAVLRLAGGKTRAVTAALHHPACRGGRRLSLVLHEAHLVEEADRRARDAEVLRRGIVERLPAALLVASRDGTVREANAGASRLFGLPRQSLVGRSLAALIGQVAAEAVDADRFLERAWREGSRSAVLSIRHLGGVVPAELSAHAFWEPPEPVLLLFGRSLSHQRRLERQLAGVHRLAVLGKLFNGTAHEVNNALSTVLAWAQWSRSRAISPEVGEALRLIEQAAGDGAHIVGRAMELARGRRGSGRPRTLDLNAVLRDAAAMCLSRIRSFRTPVRLEERLAPSAPVEGHPAELRELVVNLVLNALEAMPHGGTLRLATRTEGEAVVLAVSDTGCGMDAAVRHRIFQPFFTTRGHRGTGLGLTLVSQIAARHGARIEVESAPGEGTTFRIVFPRAAGSPAPGPPAGGEGTSRRRPRGRRASAAPTGRVLLVDDQEAIRHLVREVLAAAGHQVRTTGRPAQAQAAVSRREFDCLLIDLNMPGLDGRMLARRARESDPAAALVMLSGAVAPGAAPEAPFDLVLAKPFDLERLVAVVEEGLALSARRRRELRAETSPARRDPPRPPERPRAPAPHSVGSGEIDPRGGR